jgi:hypothetical protein
MIRQQLQVEDFFRKMGQEIGVEPGFRYTETRLDLVEEETRELRQAIEARDFLSAIDALCDLMYVTIGCAVSWGVDIEPFFDEVHGANMQKHSLEFPDLEAHRIVKPDGWIAPDHETVLQFMIRASECVQEQLIQKNGRRPEPRDVKTFWALQRVSRFMERVVLDEFAKAVRDEWATYATETLGDKAPAGFTKPWEETGEWGKEGNRRVAQRMLNLMVSKLISFEVGEVQSTSELQLCLDFQDSPSEGETNDASAKTE